MKKIFYYIITVVMIVCLLVVPVFATEAVSDEEITEVVKDISSEETTPHPSTESTPSPEGEGSGGDATEGETETKPGFWETVKRELSRDTQFWALLIMGLIMILVVICVIFVLLAVTNPTQRKSMRGMAKAADIVQNIKNENSQTLENLKKDVENIYIENEEKLIKIAELEETIRSMLESDQREKRNMLMAFAYDMRIHKLVCDRLAMPVTDKSTIDMWYARGIELIKDELNEEDIARIESVTAILDSVGERK